MKNRSNEIRSNEIRIRRELPVQCLFHLTITIRVIVHGRALILTLYQGKIALPPEKARPQKPAKVSKGQEMY